MTELSEENNSYDNYYQEISDDVDNKQKYTYNVSSALFVVLVGYSTFFFLDYC